MEAMISSLVGRFERGKLSRRDLVQGLALLASAGGVAEAQVAEPGAGQKTVDPKIKGARIDHVSIQVEDLPRSIAFYEKIFGFTILGEDKPNEIVRLGSGKVLVSLHHKNPTALVDHFAIGVEGFNRDNVTRQLKQFGVEPQENLDAGFHIKDPEGISVQIVGA